MCVFLFAGGQAADSDRNCTGLLQHARSSLPPQVLRGDSRRVAFLLRGGGFRNQDRQHNVGSCCNGSEFAQRMIADNHHRFVFSPLEDTGAQVDVFISTYKCQNGRQWEGLLSEWYSPRLVSLQYVESGQSDASATTMRGYATIGTFELAMQIEYDFVLSMRLDSTANTPFPGCLLSPLRPLDAVGASDHNKDNLQLVRPAQFKL